MSTKAQRDEARDKITPERVRAVLGNGPLTNQEIRRFLLGEGNEELDSAGCRTTAVLQQLKRARSVHLVGGKWVLTFSGAQEAKQTRTTCVACAGRGYVVSE